MHSINGTNIVLTRGDSLIITLSLTKDGQTYIPARTTYKDNKEVY